MNMLVHTIGFMASAQGEIQYFSESLNFIHIINVNERFIQLVIQCIFLYDGIKGAFISYAAATGQNGNNSNDLLQAYNDVFKLV